ncbi:MAG TPA: hypothetical protein VLI39_12370 [Sedimentisphaerales bacterium]|nr:hypothetical protein [Sedimentisphaerales bacterium]
MEQQRLTQEERLLLAEYTTDQLKTRASATKQLLASLLRNAQAFQDQINVLKDSDQGKRIAADGFGLVAYSDLEAHPVASVTEIKAKADAASALANILEVSANDPDAAHIPSTDTQDKINDLHFWAQDRTTRLAAQQSLLNNILQDAPSDIDPSKRPTLRVALESYRSRWHRLLAEFGTLGEALAANEARQTVVEASRLARLEAANARAELIRQEAQAEIEKIRAESQAAILQQEAATKRLLSDAQTKYNDLMAEVESLRKQADANRTAKGITSGIEEQKILDAAKKQQMIALAKSPRVQSLLTPFTTHGYWQPGLSKPTYDKGPVSLSQLGKALDPSPDGLSALLKIVIDKSDKERPRRRYSMFLSRLSPTQFEELKETQRYLIELGKTMVELGMLAE